MTYSMGNTVEFINRLMATMFWALYTASKRPWTVGYFAIRALIAVTFALAVCVIASPAFANGQAYCWPSASAGMSPNTGGRYANLEVTAWWSGSNTVLHIDEDALASAGWSQANTAVNGVLTGRTNDFYVTKGGHGTFTVKGIFYENTPWGIMDHSCSVQISGA